jgi:MFS family permease
MRADIAVGSSVEVVERTSAWRVSRSHAWLIFAVTCGLLLSDYMSRQVLNAVFPMLKMDWSLTDTELGSLVSVVALAIGVLTVPLSLLADAFGRVKSLVLMALLWNVATLGCGLATDFREMFAARLVVGIGAAAYGSVGAAVLIAVFPPTMRSTINGSFLAASVFGSVFGLAIGGVLAGQFGWRAAFDAMAVFGIVLAFVYPFVVFERHSTVPPIETSSEPEFSLLTLTGLKRLGRELAAAPSLSCAFVGGGLQLFVLGAFIAWMPSFLNRTYRMPAHQSAIASAGFVLVAGVGMVLCGAIADAASRSRPSRRLSIAALYCLLTTILLLVGFALPPGGQQLTLIGIALFFSGGATGPSAAVGADVSRASAHATVMALAAMANNLLGLAPGPLLTGMIADHSNLVTALRIVPLVGVIASFCLWAGRRYYDRDLSRVRSWL